MTLSIYDIDTLINKRNSRVTFTTADALRGKYCPITDTVFWFLFCDFAIIFEVQRFVPAATSKLDITYSQQLTANTAKQPHVAKFSLQNNVTKHAPSGAVIRQFHRASVIITKQYVTTNRPNEYQAHQTFVSH